MDALGPRSRLALLLDHFATLKDTRQAWQGDSTNRRGWVMTGLR
jgi:hypothetical protein